MRVNLFAYAVLAVIGLQSYSSGQTTQWQPSPNIRPAGFVQKEDDKPDVEALQATIEKLELRLREVEDDVQERLESATDVEDIEEQTDAFEKRMADLEKSFEKSNKSLEKVEDTLPNLLFHSHGSPKLQFFGRIHIDYWAFPNFDESLAPLEADGDPQDRFNFRRLRIGVKGTSTTTFSTSMKVNLQAV